MKDPPLIYLISEIIVLILILFVILRLDKRFRQGKISGFIGRLSERNGTLVMFNLYLLLGMIAVLFFFMWGYYSDYYVTIFNIAYILFLSFIWIPGLFATRLQLNMRWKLTKWDYRGFVLQEFSLMILILGPFFILIIYLVFDLFTYATSLAMAIGGIGLYFIGYRISQIKETKILTEKEHCIRNAQMGLPLTMIGIIGFAWFISLFNNSNSVVIPTIGDTVLTGICLFGFIIGSIFCLAFGVGYLVISIPSVYRAMPKTSYPNPLLLKDPEIIKTVAERELSKTVEGHISGSIIRNYQKYMEIHLSNEESDKILLELGFPKKIKLLKKYPMKDFLSLLDFIKSRLDKDIDTISKEAFDEYTKGKMKTAKKIVKMIDLRTIINMSVDGYPSLSNIGKLDLVNMDSDKAVLNYYIGEEYYPMVDVMKGLLSNAIETFGRTSEITVEKLDADGTTYFRITMKWSDKIKL